MVLTAPYVPETIVVHLGYPTAAAQNVTVSFLDYIKNVASSEIYPTWPEAALRANIYAQISFTLNRIYTEWYRSQGYDFDITNTTQFDHAFVYERSIFDTVSQIVDELFTTYIRRIGQVAPFPAPYCDGRQTRCDGLEQWGTVYLAEQGYDSFQILQYYYGEDIELVPDTPVLSYTPSYPGTVDEATWYQISYIYTVVKRLSELESEGVEYTSYTQILPTEIGLGYSGVGIDLLQYFLSVIGLFNSSFPQVQITGVFDNVTEEAVKDLQINNALPVTGVVDKTTWDLLYDQFLGISFILPSLLTRVPIEPYDGVVLRQGSTGERVELLQRYLNGVAGVYTDVPTVEVLGIFGPQTYNSVLQFQRMFGLTADGVVGRNTWEMLLDVYESTLRRQNPDVPQYPGYPLLEGMSD